MVEVFNPLARYLIPNGRLDRIWSLERKYALWRDLSLCWIEAQLRMEKGSEAEIEFAELCVRLLPSTIEVDEILELEKITHHDVQAFLIWLGRQLPEQYQPYLHRGLTSSVLVDTANMVRLRESTIEIVSGFSCLHKALGDVVETLPPGFDYVGHTHGQPVTRLPMRSLLRRWRSMMYSSWNRMGRLKFYYRIDPGPIPGSVVPIEDTVVDVFASMISTKWLLCEPQILPTQTLNRNDFVDVLYEFSRAANLLAQIATDIRFLHLRKVVSLSWEAKSSSSCMPGKNNPISLEKICGIAHLIRGYLVSASASATLWEERDISHSVVDRETYGPSCIMLNHAVSTLYKAVLGIRVLPDNQAATAVEGLDRYMRLLELQNDGVSYEGAWENVRERNRPSGESLERSRLSDERGE